MWWLLAEYDVYTLVLFLLGCSQACLVRCAIDWYSGGWGFDHWSGHIRGPLVKIWSRISTAILSLLLIQVGSYWRKYGHLVLDNCLGSLPRNSVDRLTDCIVDFVKPQNKRVRLALVCHVTFHLFVRSFVRQHPTLKSGSLLRPSQGFWGTGTRAFISGTKV